MLGPQAARAYGRRTWCPQIGPALSCVSYPQLQLPKAKERQRALSAPILSAPFLSSDRSSAGDGSGLENQCADVYRLVRYLSRSRVCSSSAIVDGVRVCREDANPLRLAYPSVVGEAEAATTKEYNAPTLPCPEGSSLRFHR